MACHKHQVEMYIFDRIVYAGTCITINAVTMSMLCSKDAVCPFASGPCPSAALSGSMPLPSTTNLSLQMSMYFLECSTVNPYLLFVGLLLPLFLPPSLPTYLPPSFPPSLPFLISMLL